MEDTSLDCERFLVGQWAQSTPLRVRRQLSGAWNCGCQLAGREVSISVASSLYGEPRYTQDTNIEIWADRTQVEALLAASQAEFYSSQEAAFEALRRKASFNLIHLESQYKIDLFVSQNRPFDQSRAQRRLVPEGFSANFWVSSPEDMVLVKLEWYRNGRQLSDRQWRDVLAILAARRGRLCLTYLRRWAGELQVGDLLEQALEQVQVLAGGAGDNNSSPL